MYAKDIVLPELNIIPGVGPGNHKNFTHRVLCYIFFVTGPYYDGPVPGRNP